MNNVENQTGGYPESKQYTQHQQDARSVYSQMRNPQSQEHFITLFKNYEPKSQCIDMAKLHESPNLKLKRYKQAVYYGEFLDCKREGQGILLYNNERLFEGNWIKDFKNGEGYEQFPNGCHYQGNYKNGKPDGFGKYYWKNGEIYEGEWEAGLKHGSGMWKGSNGDSYIGEWRQGKADGYGVHTWSNGDRYEGQFKQCLKHGEGIEKFANGDIYKGSYENGKPSGFGQYYWNNGSYFKGHFKNGLRDGQGIWKKGPGNCDKYEGEYVNDKKSGYGIFTWENGNTYKGNYEGDLRHGYGQMYWIDGTYYKGQWSKGVQNGKGQLYIPDAGFKKGIFENNILVQIQVQSSRLTGAIDGSRALRKESIEPAPTSLERTKFRTRAQTNKLHRSRNLKLDQSHNKQDTTESNYGMKTYQKNPKSTLNHYYMKNKPKELSKNNLQPHAISYERNKGKDRVLHSAFYLKKLHNKKSVKAGIGSNLKQSLKDDSDYYGDGIQKNSQSDEKNSYFRRQIRSVHSKNNPRTDDSFARD